MLLKKFKNILFTGGAGKRNPVLIGDVGGKFLPPIGFEDGAGLLRRGEAGVGAWLVKRIPPCCHAYYKLNQPFYGILVANEIVDVGKKKKKQVILFKVDFEKAYNLVGWNFLDIVMTNTESHDKMKEFDFIMLKIFGRVSVGKRKPH